MNPARVRVLPNQTLTARVECRKPRPRVANTGGAGTGAATTPSGANRKPPTRRASAPPKKGGCTTNPDLPPGYVTIATEPYSTVFWGDRKLGETPLSSERLPAGCVKLRAVAEDGKSRTVKIEVEPNLTRVYKFKI